MYRKTYVEYMADFETTVEQDQKSQTETAVWAAALCPLEAADDPKSVTIDGKLSDFMRRIDKMLYHNNVKIFFHNLKFDGTFIITYLLNSKYWKPYGYESEKGLVWYKDTNKMPNGTYTYSISSKGIWYSIELQNHGHNMKIIDSLKLLPFSVKKIGKDFGLKHQKLEMEYVGDRKPGCARTEEEDEYIANDVLVVKEALNFMHSQGHDNLTIGTCCLHEFKKYYDKKSWEMFYPNLYKAEYATQGIGDAPTAGDYIRKSYRGGWCYVKPEKTGKIYYNGTTCDVNSLYPSMMHSDSGNRFPVGAPIFWHGNFIPPKAKEDDKYYFIRVRTRFYLKKDHVPCIQIKDNPMYHPREWLTTSDIIHNGQAYTQYMKDGEVVEAIPELTLTMTDWELIQDQYDLKDTEIIDGCYFNTVIGLFDDYINKYAELKMKAQGALRQLAKLFLNNLYGKFAMSTDSSYQVLYLNEDGAIRSYQMEENDKEPGYIPIGSAITSYARNFTIRAAQKNYKSFIYADTDSIHCDCGPDEIVGCPEDPVKFNHWKYEACWDEALFVRQKTYAEHVTHENREKIDRPYWNLKCAGMPDRAKKNFIYSIEQNIKQEDFDKLSKEEQDYIKKKRTIEDFKIGLSVPGSIKSKRIKGGVLLVSDVYVMRPRII